MIFIFIVACTPANNPSSEKVLIKSYPNKSEEGLSKQKLTKKNVIKKKIKTLFDQQLLNEMEIILPQYENVNITKNLINSFELSIYKKEINNGNPKANI